MSTPSAVAARVPRFIFISSLAARQPNLSAYGASKAAMEHLVRTWADELENTTVRAALVDPGAMRTKMRAEAMPGEDPETLPDPSEIGPLIVELAQAELAVPAATVLFSAP